MSKVSDLFGDGISGELLKGEYTTDKVYEWFQKRHMKSTAAIGKDGYYRTTDDRGREHEWKAPLGLRLCLKQPLIHCQMVTKYPWYVTWVSPKTGRRLKKYFMVPASAIEFIATRAQYVDSKATVVSRHGYDIPHPLRGKIPKPWKWCPCCMTARRFRRVLGTDGLPIAFSAYKKEWNAEKQRYEFRDRKLALMRCSVCLSNNRNHHFRRSNQPWEVRKFKPGVTRARRNRRRRG